MQKTLVMGFGVIAVTATTFSYSGAPPTAGAIITAEEIQKVVTSPG